MSDEILTQEQDNMEVDYIAQIENLKRDTVSRDQYDKMKQENKRLLDALVNNKQLDDINTQPAPKRSLQEIIKDQSKANSNLEFHKLALEYRERFIEEKGIDPFVEVSPDGMQTDEARARGQKIADGYQYCIDYADGDDDIFGDQLQRIIVDVPFPKPKVANKRK